MPPAVAAWAWMKSCRGAEWLAWVLQDSACLCSLAVWVWAVEPDAGSAELAAAERQTNHVTESPAPEALRLPEEPEA